MNTKASISSSYRWRLGVVALFCLAFSAWFFYDAVVKYPKQIADYAEYERLKTDHPQDYMQRWDEYARAHGLEPTSAPVTRQSKDIPAQYILGALTGVVGLAFLVSYVRSGGRWIAADDQGLHTSWGQHAPWGSLTSIDKARWKTKGIAVVHYKDPAAGSERKLTLDDWKYDRDPTTELVAQVDAQLGNVTPPEPTQITPAGDVTTAQRKAEELAS